MEKFANLRQALHDLQTVHLKYPDSDLAKRRLEELAHFLPLLSDTKDAPDANNPTPSKSCEYTTTPTIP